MKEQLELWFYVFRYLHFYVSDGKTKDLINALPGNGSVNMVQHAIIDEAVFYVVRATPSAC
jgi:hypothetical protein